MPCRVGITTNPKERKQYWESQCAGFRYWTCTGPYSRKRAQEKETQMAKTHGCHAHPGGAKPDDGSVSWYVYHFTYTRMKP